MSRRSVLLFCLASSAWGLGNMLAAVALRDFSVGVTVFGRAACGAILLVPVVLLRGGFGALRGRWREVVCLAIFDLTAPALLITVALRWLPSSVTGTLIAAVPLAVAALAWRLDVAERVTGTRLGGLIVGILGVAVLLGAQVDGGLPVLVGAVLVLCAAASFAAGALYYKRHFREDRPLEVVTGALVVCAALTVVPAALTLPSSAPSALSTGALAALGLGCTGGGYIAFYALIGLVGAGRAAVINYVAPALAVLAGVLLLGEPFTAATVAGSLLILAGSWLATGGRPPKLPVRSRPPPRAPAQARP